MIGTIFLGLLAALPAAFASPLTKKAVLDDCLAAANVPFDQQGSPQWTSDALPFNKRLPYVPASIAAPLTIEHIQAAVKCGVDNKVKVSPKCGGHNYANFGFGGEDGHLMIELDHMHNVTVDSATGIATIQAGSRLGHVALQLFNQGGKAISHGTCPGVGIGGHVLHGGYGMSSHTRGLALDWLVGAKVVLANSSVVTVSETENPDLLWALKGAGSSFGVVAEFHFKTFDAPPQATSFYVGVNWNTTQAVNGLRVLQDWAANEMPSELNMRMYISSPASNLEGMFYGDAAGLHAALDPVLAKMGLSLSPTATKTTGWLDSLLHFTYGTPLEQTDNYTDQENFYSSSLYTDQLTDSQLESFASYWFNVGVPLRSRNWWIQLDLHGGKNSGVSAVPADSASYAHRNKLLMYQFYDRVNLSDVYPQDGFSFLDGFVNAATTGASLDDRSMYFNYPDSNLGQDVAQERYWGQNLARLKQIKAELDPNEVFYFPQSVRPASIPS